MEQLTVPNHPTSDPKITLLCGVPVQWSNPQDCNILNLLTQATASIFGHRLRWPPLLPTNNSIWCQLRLSPQPSPCLVLVVVPLHRWHWWWARFSACTVPPVCCASSSDWTRSGNLAWSLIPASQHTLVQICLKSLPLSSLTHPKSTSQYKLCLFKKKKKLLTLYHNYNTENVHSTSSSMHHTHYYLPTVIQRWFF